MIDFQMMRLRSLVLALCAVAVFAAAAPADVTLRPGKLIVSNGEEELRAEPGSYCLSSEPDESGGSQSVCADTRFPTPRPGSGLAVRPRSSLTLGYFERAGVLDEIERISATLVRVRANHSVHEIRSGFDAKPAGEGGSRWTLRLPKRLERANALSLFVRFDEGDASFVVGLRR